MAGEWRVDPSVTLQELRKAFPRVIYNHPSLLRYYPTAQEVSYLTTDVQSLTFSCIGEAETLEDTLNISSAHFHAINKDPFDKPLWRLTLSKELKQGKKVLILVIHHSISDAMSLAILRNSVSQALQNKPLKPEKSNYTDFVSAIHQSVPSLRRDVKFWEGLVDQGIVHLPSHTGDRSSTEPQVRMDFSIPESQAKIIRENVKRAGSSHFKAYLASCLMAVQEFTGTLQPNLAMITHGRFAPNGFKDLDVMNTVGSFAWLDVFPFNFIGNSDKERGDSLNSILRDGREYGQDLRSLLLLEEGQDTIKRLLGTSRLTFNFVHSVRILEPSPVLETPTNENRLLTLHARRALMSAADYAPDPAVQVICDDEVFSFIFVFYKQFYSPEYITQFWECIMNYLTSFGTSAKL